MADTALSPTHAAAHAYARRGWRVIPVRPGEKRPAVDQWPTVATLDPDKIDDWWGRWPTFGVGIVTGLMHDGHGLYLFVVDVDIAHDKGGDETLAALEQEHGPLPDTVEAHTGSGGRHLLFTSTVEIRNEQARRLGAGIDIRGVGGFIVAAPTTHPNGRQYVWEVEHHPDDIPVATAPPWLIELLTSEPEGTPRAERTPAPPYTGTPRIGDRVAASITWPELLTRDGARFERNARDRFGNTYELWSRSGVDDGHTAATLYWGGTDRLKVFSSNWPGLTELETYDRYRYIVATRYGNDYTRATRELSRELNDDALRALTLSLEAGVIRPVPLTDTHPASDPTVPVEHGWEFEEISAWIDGTAQRIVPRWLTREDGAAMLYTGRINMLIGESGSGKSWVALTACVEAFAADLAVIYVDLEDHPQSIVGRLRALGATTTQLRDRFAYTRPQIAAGVTALDYIDHAIVDRHAALVVIDSVGEAMALQSMKQNDDDEVARWYRHFARRWAELGPAIILVDHVPKSTDASRFAPIGSQRKKAASDGAMYRVDQVKSLAVGEHGVITLTVAKDRNGAFPNEHVAATCHYKSNHDGTVMTYQIAVPEERNEQGEVVRPTVLMERLSKALEHGPALTYNQLMKATSGNTAGKRRAIDILITEGYVNTHAAPNNAIYHHSIKPYRNDTVPDAFGPEMAPNTTTDTSDTTARPRRDQVAPTTPATRRDQVLPPPYVVGAVLGRADGRPAEESPTSATNATNDPLDDLF